MTVNDDLGYAEIRNIFIERDRRAALDGSSALKMSPAVSRREVSSAERRAGRYERTPETDEFVPSRRKSSPKSKQGKRLTAQSKSAPRRKKSKKHKMAPGRKIAFLLAGTTALGGVGYGAYAALGNRTPVNEAGIVEHFETPEGRISIGDEEYTVGFDDFDVTTPAVDETVYVVGVEHVSDNLIDFLKTKESFEPEAYLCPAGVLTIGWGHTKDVHEGQVITQEEGEEFLRQDLEECENDVLKYAEKYGITFAQGDDVENSDELKIYRQGVFDAIVDFRYNLGPGGFASSDIMEILAEDGLDATIEHLLKFVKARNPDTGEYEVLRGLETRRREEAAMMHE